MITYESVPEGTHWKVMRNQRLICYFEDRAQAEQTLIGYYRRATDSGKAACIIITMLMRTTAAA